MGTVARWLVAGAAAALLGSPVAQASPAGSLDRIGATPSCVREGHLVTGACRRGDRLFAASDIVVSPDGRNLYAAGGVLYSFRRNPRTGALHQLRGQAGCAFLGGRCKRTRALHGVGAVAISSNGRDVYAVDAHGVVAAFTRDGASGVLTQQRRPGGCVSGTIVRRCEHVPVLWQPRAVVVTGDGHYVYAAGGDAGAVVGLARGSAPQRPFAELPGPTGCVNTHGSNGCNFAGDFGNVSTVALSDDDADLYAADESQVMTFARNLPAGGFAQAAGRVGCLSVSGSEGCGPLHGLLSSSFEQMRPSGAGFVLVGRDSLLSFARHPSSGALTQLAGGAGCVTSPRRRRLSPDRTRRCAPGRGLDRPSSLATTQDGKNVYVGSGSGRLAVFRRSNRGGLRQLSGAHGCIGLGVAGPCRGEAGGEPVSALAASPDGRFVYAAAQRRIIVLRRQR